jgi:hypothetical protein
MATSSFDAWVAKNTSNNQGSSNPSSKSSFNDWVNQASQPGYQDKLKTESTPPLDLQDTFNSGGLTFADAGQAMDAGGVVIASTPKVNNSSVYNPVQPIGNTTISQAPPEKPKNVIQKIGDFINNIFNGNQETRRIDEIARSQNAYQVQKVAGQQLVENRVKQIAKDSGMSYDLAKTGIENLAKQQGKSVYDVVGLSLNSLVEPGGNPFKQTVMEEVSKELGLRGMPTNSELANDAMTAMLGLGLVTAPVPTVMGLGVFTGANELKSGLISTIKGEGFKFGKGYTLSDLFNEAGHNTKVLLDTVDFLIVGSAAAGVFKASPKVAELLTKDLITKYDLPKTISLNPSQVKEVVLGQNEGYERDLLASLGLDSASWRKAVKEGINIDIPAEKTVSLVDKPYWQKFKELVGKESTTRIVSQDKAGQTSTSQKISGLLNEGDKAAVVGTSAPVSQPTSESKPVFTRDKTLPTLDSAIKNYVADAGVYTSPDGKPQVTPALNELTDLANTPEIKKFTLEQVKKADASGVFDKTKSGDIILYRAGNDYGDNRLVSATYDKTVAQNINLGNESRGKSRPVNELIVKPEDIKVFVGGSEAEVLIQKSEKPVLYHATPEKFSKFDLSKTEGGVAWFTDNPKEIKDNTVGAVQGAGQKLNIMTRTTAKEMKWATPEQQDQYYSDQLIQMGYDGVKMESPNGKGNWYKVFDPNNSLKEIPIENKSTSKSIISVDDAIKSLNDYYAKSDQNKFGEAWSQAFIEMDVAEPGQRIWKDGRVVGGISSTFPSWVPEELRSTKLFKSVMDDLLDPTDIKYPPNSQPRKQALYDAFLSEVDQRAGLDSSGIINKIKESYGQEKTRLQKVDNRSSEGSQRTTRPEAKGSTTSELSAKSKQDLGQIKESLPVDQQPSGIGKIRNSRAYERIVERYGSEMANLDVSYNRMDIAKTIENAIDFTAKDPERALRIAFGMEEAPAGQKTRAINMVLADKALRDGNNRLWNQLEAAGSLRQTRLGQEIVLDRGRFNADSPHVYLQEVLDRKLASLGEKIDVKSIRDTLKLKPGEDISKVGAKRKAVAKIDQEAAKLKSIINKLDRDKVKLAQDVINSLRC